MKNTITALIGVIVIAVLLAYVTPAASANNPTYPTPKPASEQIQGDVWYPPSDLGTWETCDITKVYNNPGENPDWYEYTLEAGELVHVREASKRDSSWWMIEPARWVKATDLCHVGD